VEVHDRARPGIDDLHRALRRRRRARVRRDHLALAADIDALALLGVPVLEDQSDIDRAAEAGRQPHLEGAPGREDLGAESVRTPAPGTGAAARDVELVDRDLALVLQREARGLRLPL